jgi:hypothetical protein
MAAIHTREPFVEKSLSPARDESSRAIQLVTDLVPAVALGEQ